MKGRLIITDCVMEIKAAEPIRIGDCVCLDESGKAVAARTETIDQMIGIARTNAEAGERIEIWENPAIFEVECGV